MEEQEVSRYNDDMGVLCTRSFSAIVALSLILRKEGRELSSQYLGDREGGEGETEKGERGTYSIIALARVDSTARSPPPSRRRRRRLSRRLFFPHFQFTTPRQVCRSPRLKIAPFVGYRRRRLNPLQHDERRRGRGSQRRRRRQRPDPHLLLLQQKVVKTTLMPWGNNNTLYHEGV